METLLVLQVFSTHRRTDPLSDNDMRLNVTKVTTI